MLLSIKGVIPSLKQKNAPIRSVLSFWLVWLIKCEPCGYPENKGIQHNYKADKAEPRKDLKEVLYE